MNLEPFDRKLRDRLNAIESDVPASIWGAIAEEKFDQDFRDRIGETKSEVPETMWDAIAAQQFDQQFAHKLQHLESAVPDTAWPAIERLLQKKKDRTPIIILLLLLLIGGAVSYGWLGLSNQQQDSLDVSTVDQESLSKMDFTTADLGGNTQTVVQITPPTGINPGQVIQSDGDQNRSQFFSPIDAKGERTQAEKSLDMNDALRENNAEKPSTIEAVDHRKISDAAAARNVDIASAIDLRDLAGVSSLTKPRIECPTLKVSSNLQPFFELTLSPGIPLRSLEDSADNDTYLQSRRETERPSTTFSIDATLGLEIKDFEIRSGISVSQVHEVFDYIDETSTRTVIDTVFDPNTGEIRDISVVREYGTRVKKTNNRYTFVDIPVMIGYRFRPRKDHSIWLRAGGYFNLLFMQRGTILSATDALIDLKEEGSNIFRKSTGFEAAASIGYELALGEKSGLGLQVNYRHPLSQLTLNAYPIRQQYRRIQVGFSWKYKF